MTLRLSLAFLAFLFLLRLCLSPVFFLGYAALPTVPA